METYAGVDLCLHAFLNSTQVGGEWSASRTGRFATADRVPGTRWIYPSVDAVAKKKKIASLLLPGIESRSFNP